MWRDRRVLVTGHTGFKGSWLVLWLTRMGAEVSGLSLPRPSPTLIDHMKLANEVHAVDVDVRDRNAVENAVAHFKPEVVFHLAGQAFVGRGYSDPGGTYATNVLGTVHVLEAAERHGARALVSVTSDKVYRNDRRGTPFVESDHLGGAEPYATSKACADIASLAWREMCRSRSALRLSTARAGNVIGGGDESPGRLLPDARRSLLSGKPLRLRYPHAVRPWQFVLDVLGGYLALAESLMSEPETTPPAVNFAPMLTAPSATVAEVAQTVFDLCGSGSWVPDAEPNPFEEPVLRLDGSLAKASLGWEARVDLSTALTMVVNWWRAVDERQDLRGFAIAQIETYEGMQ